MGKTKEISVFVDESGSYDPDETSSLYYMVCLVFHDQDSDISGEITKLEEAIAATGRDAKHCVHTAPLIRRESELAFFGNARLFKRNVLAQLSGKDF